jgi:DNA-binding transcriptional MerR regulator
MKIRELVMKTGVPKQTIHNYLRAGLLPKPRKLGPNSAEYDERHVERIHLIKQLQESYYLPLAAVKKVLKKYKKSSGDQTVLKMKIEYFRPLDQLMGGQIEGEEAFLKATGLNPGPLHKYEEWGLISPVVAGERKFYSRDDQIIGRIIAEYRDIGLTPETGFDPEFLQDVLGQFREIVATASRSFFETAPKTMKLNQMVDVSNLAAEVTALFYYHLYHKLVSEERENRLEALGWKQQQSGS